MLNVARAICRRAHEAEEAGSHTGHVENTDRLRVGRLHILARAVQHIEEAAHLGVRRFVRLTDQLDRPGFDGDRRP